MKPTTATYNPGDILRESKSEICRILGNALETITVDRIVIGLFFTGVKLNNGAGGLCFTPIKAIPEAVCCPSSAKVMPASGKLEGRKAVQFLDEMLSGNPLKKAMGIAVLNALSMTCWTKEAPKAYKINIGVDALDEMVIPEECFVIVVGALVPVLRKLKQRGKPFGVIELDPSTLKADEMEFLIPLEEVPEMVAKADLFVITGATLVNDTLEGFLQLRKPGAETILVGPTASMLPDAFFRRGVNVIGGVMVTNADSVLNVIAEAGSGYHFFGKGAERFVIQGLETANTMGEGSI